MDKMYESLARHDKVGPAALALGALTLLAAVLWQAAPGIGLLLAAPALTAGLVRLAVTQVYGLRMGTQRMIVMNADGDTVIPYEEIAHLRLADRCDASRVTLVTRDGRERDVPLALRSNQLELIRAATDRGIPVRTS